MVGLYGGEPLEYAAINEEGLDAVPSGSGIGAAIGRGFAASYIPRLLRAQRHHIDPLGATEMPPPSPAWAPNADSGIVGDLAARDAEDLPRVPTLDPESAISKYGVPGRLTFDKPILETIAKELHDHHREAALRDSQIERSNSGLVAGGLRMGAELATGLLDPVNVASAFVPVVGPARYAAALAQAGSAAGRAGVRAGVGAAEGAVGSALLQPLEFGLSRSEYSDYTMADALRNIAFGAALGSGLHVVGGAVADRVTGKFSNPITQQIEDVGPEARELALRGALAQTIEGKPVDVAPVLDGAQAMRAGDPVAARAAADDMFSAARREPAEDIQAKALADDVMARPSDDLVAMRQEVQDLEQRLGLTPEQSLADPARIAEPSRQDPDSQTRAAPEAIDPGEARAAAVDRAAACIMRGFG
jgi:hypothetical protein